MNIISVNTPIKIYCWGEWHIPEPCPVRDCPYVTAPGHNGLCMKHWWEKQKKGNKHGIHKSSQKES